MRDGCAPQDNGTRHVAHTGKPKLLSLRRRLCFALTALPIVALATIADLSPAEAQAGQAERDRNRQNSIGFGNIFRENFFQGAFWSSMPRDIAARRAVGPGGTPPPGSNADQAAGAAAYTAAQAARAEDDADEAYLDFLDARDARIAAEAARDEAVASLEKASRDDVSEAEYELDHAQFDYDRAMEAEADAEAELNIAEEAVTDAARRAEDAAEVAADANARAAFQASDADLDKAPDTADKAGGNFSGGLSGGRPGGGGNLLNALRVSRADGQTEFDVNLFDFLGALGNATLGFGAGSGGSASPVRLAVSGNFADFSDGRGAGERDGESFTVRITGIAEVGETGQAGGYFSYQTAEVTGGGMRSERDAFGFGAMGSLALAPDLRLGGEVDYTRGLHDVSTGAATGEFDTDELTVRAVLIKSHEAASWFSEGGADISYALSEGESYTNSAGTVISGFNTQTASMGIGGRVGLHMGGRGGLVQAVRPWLGSSVNWDFVNEGDIGIVGGPAYDTADLRFNFSGGAQLLLTGGGTASVHAGYTGSDSAFESVTVGGEMSMPLANFGGLDATPFAFMADNGGSLNFNVDRYEANSTMMLRLEVPLN